MKFTGASLITAVLTICASLSVKASDIGTPKSVTYDGGIVMTGLVNIYFIFYGNWQDEHQVQLMDFVDSLSNTAWFNTLRLYNDRLGNNVTGPLYFAAAINDNYSHGRSLQGNATHIDIIEKAIESAYLGKGTDHAGIYFILAAEDVDEEGLCTKWCAYNSYTSDFVYAFIGHPNKCPQLCIPELNRNVSPNGDPALDATVNMIAHELVELMTDPHNDAWRVGNSTASEEISEWCMPPNATPEEWFGPNVQKLDSGASWNLQVNDTKWLIQSVWNPVAKKCVMSS
ncbi:phosphate-induced protein 1 [Jimgerdemannia flammicorona]|uniref:Phosphate-induced protein 1 n=1 Tax=Jimgerdemannia flammicorona TaxID=994334 RepID=A0A433CYA3_9FUNG|nr:phosphate-induced protein 1 [Jimgerdemannia flammicorona]